MPMKMIDNFDKERYAPEMFEFRHEKSQDIAGIRKVHEATSTNIQSAIFNSGSYRV
jgi:hypothetical protein